MTFTLPPRLHVAALPTPVRRLERATARLRSAVPDAPDLWIKHDDDTGGVLTGNKIRKLQFTVREAIDSGADTLVTCGGLQSNHCRATAVLARRMGLEVVLCLRTSPATRGAPPSRLEGNLLLDRIVGADIRVWTPEEYADNVAGMARVAEELRAAGRRPFVIAEGCSMPSGCLGYIEAAQEIAHAEAELDLHWDAIVHAVGSGGTTAGLELGVRLFGLDARPIGIPVCDDAAWFRPRIAMLCAAASARHELGVHVPSGEIDLRDGHAGDGYGVTRPEELASLLQLARDEGVVLDPVYTGKAWHGLLAEITAGRLPGAKNVLFLHTGGAFGLQAHESALAAALG
jgi:D-cysteine desulfhydrase